MTLILGIESSCDETAAAVVKDGRQVLSNVVASQHELHERYRGVVPEIASRAHLERITPVINEALDQADTDIHDLTAIAVGNRPGLIGSLMVGISAAKAAAWAADKPLIGVNHVHAHLHSAALAFADSPAATAPTYPALGLVVSGGHSSIYLVKSTTEYKLLGRTIDDAVGEAYDKAAVILGLGYPGGPAVDKCAQKGNPTAHKLPRSLLAPDSLDFSFSGLKTALLYAVRGHPKGRGPTAVYPRSLNDHTDQQIADLAASFQAAAIDTLIQKIQRAIDSLANTEGAPTSILIGGGVSANSLLRQRITDLGQQINLPIHIPAFAFCLDNAAMIAGLAHELHQQNQHAPLTLPAIATLRD